MIIQDNADVGKQIVELKVMVACDYNGNGEPDFFFCKVRCLRDEYAVGDHYSLAERKAIDEGYGGKMVSFDEHDNAGRAILDHFVWETATTYTV